MKQNRTLLMIILSLSISFGFNCVSLAESPQDPETKAILTLLFPETVKEIKKQFPDRSFDLWNAEILAMNNVNNEDYSIKLSVKYNTYTGAHNPPEGNIVVTYFITLDGVRVLGLKSVE
ncbi:DUF3888 domain-containing protein [Alkalihalobacillus sp. FSL W8-0930]